MPDETDEWDPGEAILLLMQRLPSDIELWRRLAHQFDVDIYVSLRMRSSSKGFSLSPAATTYLGERGIETGFDILYSKEPFPEQGVPNEPLPSDSISSASVHQNPDTLSAPASGE